MLGPTTLPVPGPRWLATLCVQWDVAALMRLGLTGIWLDRHLTGLPDTPLYTSPHHPH